MFCSKSGLQKCKIAITAKKIIGNIIYSNIDFNCFTSEGLVRSTGFAFLESLFSISLTFWAVLQYSAIGSIFKLSVLAFPVMIGMIIKPLFGLRDSRMTAVTREESCNGRLA